MTHYSTPYGQMGSTIIFFLMIFKNLAQLNDGRSNAVYIGEVLGYF